MSRKQLVLGMDAGTHSIRVLGVELPSGRIVCRSEAAYRRITGPGIQELEASSIDHAFRQALEGLQVPDGYCVTGLGISHQRGTVIPVSGDGQALHNAFCDSDMRALDADEFRQMGGNPEAYYEESGCPVVSFNGLMKILWCRKNEPDLFSRAAAWLSPQDYLISRVNGRVISTEGSLSRSGLLDVHRRIPDAAIFQMAGLQETEFVPLGGRCGMVRLPDGEEVPVFAALGDQPSAVVGCGCQGTGMPAMNLGTTFVCSSVAERPFRDPDGRITVEVLPFGKYSPEYGTGAGGQFIDYLMRVFPDSAGTSLDEKDARMRRAGNGAHGLRAIPLLWKVMSSGISGRFVNLEAAQSTDDFYRAAYEGLAAEARLSAEKVLGKAGGEMPIMVFGGLSGSDLFSEILSAMLGRPVARAGSHQGSAFGAAVMAAVGNGSITSSDQVSVLSAEGRTITCAAGAEMEYYEDYFSEYKVLRGAVPAKVHECAEAGRGPEA